MFVKEIAIFNPKNITNCSSGICQTMNSNPFHVVFSDIWQEKTGFNLGCESQCLISRFDDQRIFIH